MTKTPTSIWSAKSATRKVTLPVGAAGGTAMWSLIEETDQRTTLVRKTNLTSNAAIVTRWDTTQTNASYLTGEKAIPATLTLIARTPLQETQEINLSRRNREMRIIETELHLTMKLPR